ncbi:hypothetical protein D3C85_1688990 [compost metagenome]
MRAIMKSSTFCPSSVNTPVIRSFSRYSTEVIASPGKRIGIHRTDSTGCFRIWGSAAKELRAASASSTGSVVLTT